MVRGPRSRVREPPECSGDRALWTVWRLEAKIGAQRVRGLVSPSGTQRRFSPRPREYRRGLHPRAPPPNAVTSELGYNMGILGDTTFSPMQRPLRPFHRDGVQHQKVQPRTYPLRHRKSNQPSVSGQLGLRLRCLRIRGPTAHPQADSCSPSSPGSSVVFLQAKRMFEGEMASLTAILKTGTVKVPRPIKVLDAPGGGSMLVMEHLDMSHLSSHAAKLGAQLADLHLDNKKLGETLRKEASTVGKGGGQVERPFVDQFGFDVVTCCGYLPQVNDWQKDWVEFYAQQRIQPQMDMVEKGSGDREARELWSALQLKIPDMFRDLDIVPALLHGDLWAGNVAEDSSGPIIFDPASFYGHSEYELAIAGMFGGFSGSFYSAYHSKIPKAPGFDKRLRLYQLFHYLNHWNHFGSGYRGSSLSIMRNLTK
nr:PREDICTED: ketosamine-3-kinase-like [Equus przewalskii]